MYDLRAESSYPTPFATSPLLPLILLSMAGQKHTPDTKNEIRVAYDYVVVGSGAAGSVVASRLAENECVTVLLLEAGKSPPKLTDLPVVYTNFAQTDLDWSFTTTPQPHAGKGLIESSFTLSAGKAVGGTTVINGMQFIRGNRKDYDDWAFQGATGWNYDRVLPYFKKMERNVDLSYIVNGYHGVNGPVTVYRPPYQSELQMAVYEAANTMGYKIIDSNGPNQTGFNDFQATIRHGQRCSSAKAYLVPTENKTNLDIVANAFVRKVIIDNGEAKGVVFDFQNQTRVVSARKEVILSAGTINSAKLLLLSGVGPKDELAKLKIPLKADLPVGQNLQEQWGALMNFELNDKIPPFSEKEVSNRSIWEYILFKKGPLTSLAATVNMGFLNTDPRQSSDDHPDYQIYFGEGIHDVVKHKLRIRSEYHRAIYEPYEDKAFYWCLSQILRPKGRGVVTLNSTDPYDPPIIDPKYFSHPEDLEIITKGMKKCKEFGRSESLRKIGSKPFRTVYPGCEEHVDDDDSYFPCMAKAILITCNHLVGTVKMGSPDDPTTVLDPQLRVKTIRNLRVVDASVMPNIPSGNTMVPTMMIAEKASDMIKQTIQC